MNVLRQTGVYVRDRFAGLIQETDLLPVNVIMPEDKEEFALTMNGKKTHLRRNDFLTFAEAAGIPRKAAEMMIRRMLGHLPAWTELCEASLLPSDMKQALIELMQEFHDAWTSLQAYLNETPIRGGEGAIILR